MFTISTIAPIILPLFSLFLKIPVVENFNLLTVLYLFWVA
jgi:hypothetical protein